MTANEYICGVKQNNWKPFDKKLWQRGYHDHIIRNNNSFEQIRNCRLTNPVNWAGDKFNGNE